MSPPSEADRELQQRLVGTYRLVEVESVDEDGAVDRPFGTHPDGLMAYTAEGFMVTVLARSDRPNFPDGDIMGGTEAQRADAFLTASAFAGSFEVRDGTLVFALQSATFQNWKGTVQVRDVTLADGILTLTTPFLMMGGKRRSSTVRLQRIS